MLAKNLLLTVILNVALTLLAACGSASDTFTPEQLQYGTGCHQGQDVEAYCGHGG
jgi:hypothetical protein